MLNLLVRALTAALEECQQVEARGCAMGRRALWHAEWPC